MFSQLGVLVYRHRRGVIAVWAVLLLIGAVLATRVDSVLKTTVGQAPTEAQKGLSLLEDELDLPPSVIIVIYHSPDLTVDDQAFRADVESSLASLPGMPDLARIDTPYSLLSPLPATEDRHATYALIWLDLPVERAIDAIPEVHLRLKEPEQVQMMVTGAPVIFSELEDATKKDLRRGEIAAIPLVLVALVLIFGGLVASGLPVLMGGVSLVLALAVMFLLGHVTDMSIFAKNIASLLALGIAVDYTLFIVSRFREEIAISGPAESIAVTMATAGKAVLFSGVTTILGLSGLLLVKFSFLRSLGLAGIVVVVLSLFVALTLVPAVLAILGPRINALPVLPRVKRPGLWWHKLATRVMASPLLFLVPSAAAILVLGIPFLGVRLGPIWSGTLPDDAPARTAWEFAAQEFGPGGLTPVLVVVQSPGPVLEPQNLGDLYEYSRRLAALPGVTAVDSIVDLAPGISKEAYQIAYRDPSSLSPEVRDLLNGVVNGPTTVLRVHVEHDIAAPEAREVIKSVRAVPAGTLTRYVTGAAASLQDSIDALYEDFPKVIVAVVISIYVTLLFLFRSVVVAFKAVAMNALSIFASFGALVFIFQEGHLEGPLGFRSDGTVEASLPILLFCMVFGLSMDYGVFLLSRIKEEYDRTGDNTQSVAQGMEKSGKIITSAAMVVVVVGFAFALGDIILTKALGLGLAIAVLIDATIIRAFLVPSLMRLLGKWNWWAPAALLRVLPRWERQK